MQSFKYKPHTSAAHTHLFWENHDMTRIKQCTCSSGILLLCCMVLHVTAESITTTTMQFMTRAVSKLTPSVTPSVTPTGAPDLAIPLWMIIVIAVVFGVTVLFALVWWCLVCLNTCKKRRRNRNKRRSRVPQSPQSDIVSDDDEAPMLNNEVVPSALVTKAAPEEDMSPFELDSDAEKEDLESREDWKMDKQKKPRPPRLSFDDNLKDNNAQAAIELKPLALNQSQLDNALQDIPLLYAQYTSVSSNKPTVRDIPDGADEKNRYRDVLPNPHSRVLLSIIPGKRNSDYINANYIHGYNDTPRAYIASQGPLYSTINDFWRMVWEQNCSAIVMTTGLEERGRLKCARYWPERRDEYDMGQLFQEYDGLEVRLLQRRKTRSYTVTTFVLTELKTSLYRKVTHYWFTAWPDHGVPETTGPLIDFILETRKDSLESDEPLLVHCSAGIGRTGVFIGADIGMRELQEKQRVDVLDILIAMRQDRGGMVQTRDQYVLLHKVLYDYGKRIGLS